MRVPSRRAKTIADTILRERKSARTRPFCEERARRALGGVKQRAVDAALVGAEDAQRLKFFDNVHGLWFAIQ